MKVSSLVLSDYHVDMKVTKNNLVQQFFFGILSLFIWITQLLSWVWICSVYYVGMIQFYFSVLLWFCCFILSLLYFIMNMSAITSLFTVSLAWPENSVRFNLCTVFVFFCISLTLFVGCFCDLGVYVNITGSTTQKICVC